MKTLFKYIIPILVLPLAFFAYKFYQNYQYEKEIDQSWRESVAPIKQQYYEALEYSRTAKAALKKEKQMLAQDHYGGKTPEETLAMFVEALKKKDAKLAAKYYLPWEWGKAESRMRLLLSKQERYNKFIHTYETGVIKVVDRAIGKAVKIYENPKDDTPYILEMILNQETGLWKISEF